MVPDPVSDLKDKAIDLLNQSELSWLSSTILDNIEDSLVLKTKAVEDDVIPLGRTKMGGPPDLPPEFEWPIWQGEPLSFIAQIDLAELPEIEFLNVLPKSGMLYFFYSAEQATSGYDPNDKGSWRVCYQNTSDVQRRRFPGNLPERGQYKSCSVTFSNSFTIPGMYSAVLDKFHLSSDELTRYMYWSFEVKNETMGRGTAKHRILGHPDQIQNDMQVECQLVSNGLYYGDEAGFNDPRAPALMAGAKNWRLLLQVDSDYDAGMMWCGVGTIYFWIPRDELERQNFDATWMIMQCD